MSFRRIVKGGSVINVSSGAARLGSPNEYVDYAASKGALETFTIGLAVQGSRARRHTHQLRTPGAHLHRNARLRRRTWPRRSREGQHPDGPWRRARRGGAGRAVVGRCRGVVYYLDVSGCDWGK